MSVMFFLMFYYCLFYFPYRVQSLERFTMHTLHNPSPAMLALAMVSNEQVSIVIEVKKYREVRTSSFNPPVRTMYVERMGYVGRVVSMNPESYTPAKPTTNWLIKMYTENDQLIEFYYNSNPWDLPI